jgi:tetratricopeptide (TPR) repeat protein
MTKKKTSSVFLSHSSVDKPFVRKLAEEFEKHGIKVWVDEGEITIGDSLMGNIEEGIKKAEYFAIVLSKHSIKSPWVEVEYRAAFSLELQNKIRVLPILIHDVEVPLFLQDKLYGDFRSSTNFAASFEELLRVFIKTPKKAAIKPSGNIPATLYPNQFLPDLKFFVGREELLKQIKDTLKKDHRASIHDISGLGKTFTTYKFAEDNRENYEKIFFIRATREEMLESLAKCGELVNSALADVKEQQSKALGFKQWLEENEKWLVIYDNVDLPDELFSYIPVSKKGDCIFTSNFREVRNLGTEINIVKLDKTDAEILLYSQANNKPHTQPDLDGNEREAFDRLIEEIDGLPLTLNSAGALIDKKQWSFADLWKRYERSNEILWESEDDYSVYQRRSAGIVFSLAYDELGGTDKIGNAVKVVLDSMSFISPDEIPEDLLGKILEARDGSFAQMEEPDDLWDDIREKITAYDLLKYNRQKKTFTTHRAIQRVIQSRLKGKEKDICIALATIFHEMFPLYDYSNREVCEKYYQHILVLLENADKFRAETEATDELYFRAGRYQTLLGNYAAAEKFHLRAAEISASVSGTKSARYATDLNDLATVYQDQGRYDEAIEKYEEALRIAEKTIGREHRDYASRLNNLGEVYRMQGRYDEAIEKYEEALRIDEKTIGREHPGYAIRLNNLAVVYRLQGRYDEAIEKYEEALRIDEKTIGREHPGYGIRLNNLASVYSDQGRYDEAIEKYEEAMRIIEKTIGREHPNYASGLNNLAFVYKELGRYDEAIEKYDEALRTVEKTIGREHPYYASSLNNLATVNEAQGKFPEALDLYKNALRIFEKTLPEGHPHRVLLKRNVERCGKLVH